MTAFHLETIGLKILRYIPFIQFKPTWYQTERKWVCPNTHTRSFSVKFSHWCGS